MSIEETSNQSPVIIDLSPATVVSTTNDDAVYDPLGDQATDTVQVVTPVKEEEKVKEEVKDLSLPKQNVVIDVNPIRDGKLKDQDSIALASDTYPALDQTLINTPSVQLEEKAEWLSNIQDGVDTEVYNGTGYERFAQPDGMFTNLLKTDQNVSLTGLYAASPKSSNNSLTGERAVLAVMNHMKVGNIYMSPLWNSGFWVSIKPPTESAVIDLMHLIRTEKVRLGRATYGLAHSSTTSVVGKYVIEFIKAHIYGTTINSKELNIDDIDRYVHMNDIDALILSIICSMYPSGFNFARSCVADPLLCNHVTEAILDPSKLLFVNRRAMTDSMLGHMSNRRLNSTTLKDVESYQSQLASRNTKSMVYSADGSSINFELKTPNIRRYIESSDRWIADIETTADRLLQKDTNDNQRDNLIRDHAKATTMRQYSHYVDSISFGDNNVVQDFESICKVLSALSTDNILSSEFNKNVNNLINFSSIAATAIPTFACPSCKKPAASRSKEDPAYVNVIPLDMISIFFRTGSGEDGKNSSTLSRVIDPGFASDKEPGDIFVRWFENIPALDSSVDATLTLMGLYDIEYGIAKYSDLISNPLLKVSAHPTENVEDDGRFDLSYRKYVDSDVYGQTGVSFDKALEMPSFRFNRLCNLAAKSAKKRSDATQDVLNTAAKQAGFPTK